MSGIAGASTARSGDVIGALRLLAFLAAALLCMVLDARSNLLEPIRHAGQTLLQPVWRLAALPAKIGYGMRESAVSRSQLIEDNRNLRNALLVNAARYAQLQAAAAENARIRALLDAAEGGTLDVQLVSILNIDLDPTRQRLVLAAGSQHGVTVGQPVIDAGGLLGQVIEVNSHTSTVLLLTDPEHMVPVMVMRSGVRLLARGSGRTDELVAANIPLTADLEVGDELLSSGLGGRFPQGFAVGQIRALVPDESRAFLVAEITPAARLDRGNEVLLLRSVVPLSSGTVLPASVDATAAPAQTEGAP